MRELLSVVVYVPQRRTYKSKVSSLIHKRLLRVAVFITTEQKPHLSLLKARLN